MSGRRSRNDNRRGTNGNNASSTMLAAMFTWTKRPATVRDVVDRQQLTVPAVVRVAKGYNERGSNRFDFPTDTIYLIREVQRHQLVVARNVDSSSYATFPRDCQLTFHLVINDNAVSPTALTLGDLLGGSDNDDEGPCNGQRVHLSADSVRSGRVPRDVAGKLELVDIYSERYLIGHAFEGATLSPELKIIPGYIPLTVDIAEGLTAGTDIKDYIAQLHAVAESTFQGNCKATDYEEVNVFAEQPNNHYEWIEPPRPTLTTQASVDSTSSMSSLSSSPASSGKFSTPSSARVMSSPETPSNSPCSRPGNTFAGRLSLDNRRRRPLPPIPSPIAEDAAKQSSRMTVDRLRNNEDRDSESAADSPYEDFDEIHETGCQPHRPADRSRSYPVNSLPRSGSVDLLLDGVMVPGCGHNVGRTSRLSSSHSLECLSSDSQSTLASGSTSSNCSDFTLMTVPGSSSRNITTADEMTSSCETVTSSTVQKKCRPPIAAKPSPDVIKDSFRHGNNSNSMLHRQRPVVRVRRGGISSSSSNISQMWRPEMLQRSATTAVDRVTSAPLTVASSLYDIHPFPGREFSRSLAANPNDFYRPPWVTFQQIGKETGSEKCGSSSTLAPSEQDEENIYDQIASPLYVDMNKLKRLVSDDSQDKRRDEQDRKEGDALTVRIVSDNEQVSTDIEGHPDYVYDQPAHGSRRLDDSELYANGDIKLQQQSDHIPTTASRKFRKRRVKVTKKTDNQTPSAAASVVPTVPAVDSEELYLKPFVLVQPGKVERGQGVGAETEEERNSLAMTTPLSTAPSAKSSVNVTPSDSNHTYTRTIHFSTAPATGRHWVTLNDVPVDVTSLTVEDVVECLQLLNLHKYVDVFREQQIDGALLASLDQQLLINDFQFKRFDAIKLEKFACHGWRPKFSAQQTFSDC